MRESVLENAKPISQASNRKIKSAPVHLRLYLQGREMQEHKDRTHQKLSRVTTRPVKVRKHPYKKRSYEKHSNFLQTDKVLAGSGDSKNKRLSLAKRKSNQNTYQNQLDNTDQNKSLNNAGELDDERNLNLLLKEPSGSGKVEDHKNSTGDPSKDVNGLLEQLKVLKESMGISEEEIQVSDFHYSFSLCLLLL